MKTAGGRQGNPSPSGPKMLQTDFNLRLFEPIATLLGDAGSDACTDNCRNQAIALKTPHDLRVFLAEVADELDHHCPGALSRSNDVDREKSYLSPARSLLLPAEVCVLDGKLLLAGRHRAESF